MVTALMPGVLEVYESNETTLSDRLFVAGGFAEVTPSRCTILAEEAMAVTALDRGQLDAEVKTLADSLAVATDAERAGLESKQTIAQAKLQALTGR